MSVKTNRPHIKIMDRGPYVVTGFVPLTEEEIVSDQKGTAVEYKVLERYPQKESYSLCRCGKSRNMPFCDGTHAKAGFEGCETASGESFAEQAERYEGPGLILEDVEDLCASARFCHLGGNTWNMVEKSDDPEARELAIRGACNCPAGRLIVRDAKTGEVIEPCFEPSIALLQDTAAGVGGPIWVRGGIPIESADGVTYEVRNRVTLCRCGKSRNMPFCDSAHLFRDFRNS